MDWTEKMLRRIVRADDDLVWVAQRAFRCADATEAKYAADIICEALDKATEPTKFEVVG